MIRKCGKSSWVVKTVLGTGILSYCSSASGVSGSIIGVVQNQTQGRPAPGEEVILLGVGLGAHEEARAKTDSQGAFTLELRQPDKPHLVRVIHQGVNYDRQVSGTNAISIDIADAAAKVKAISGSIEIIRAGAQGNLLHVSDMVEIKNDSNPPMTEASERTFEVYLPIHAKIDSVLAAGPEDIGVTISPMPVQGEPGRYAVNFPLRPGSTKFAFNYDLPYDGHAIFRTKNMYSLQQLAVMIPPSMTFASRSAAFQMLPVGNSRYRVEAAEKVKAGEGPEFEISGVGALPPVQGQVHSPPGAPAPSQAAPAVSAQDNRNKQAQSAKSLGAVSVVRSSAPSSRVQWGVLSVAAIAVLATCVVLASRRPRSLANTPTEAVQGSERTEQTRASLVEALKDGLFQLETDRVQGSIPEDEYASARQALERAIQWALTRAAARIETATQELSPDKSHTSIA